MQKISKILLEALPIILMVGLIPVIPNDYYLTVVYLVIIFVALKIRTSKNDILFLCFGFLIMIVSEYFFISTGVETFNRTSLFGIMPLWLPVLWAYGFVAIKRALEILK